ncbi:MAG: TIGR03618 family F420-dependent PPOX class oxidoreductase [Chloroflexi bacterium]|nr:TIGR03618 family F420-dependent PPOX class oxidoreductase [Chloroflexota bacterium]
MKNTLSTWAQQFLREDRVAVVSTLNKDGSPFVTTIWYVFQEDGTIIMNTPSGTQKVKNLQRDPRIGVCVGDGMRSVSLYGTVTISSDQNVMRRDLELLTARYVKDEAARAQTLAFFLQQDRVSLHFKPVRVTEFSVDQGH